jgi:hypothetical protein
MSDIIVPLDPKLIVARSCPANATVYRLALLDARCTASRGGYQQMTTASRSEATPQFTLTCLTAA